VAPVVTESQVTVLSGGKTNWLVIHEVPISIYRLTSITRRHYLMHELAGRRRRLSFLSFGHFPEVCKKIWVFCLNHQFISFLWMQQRQQLSFCEWWNVCKPMWCMFEINICARRGQGPLKNCCKFKHCAYSRQIYSQRLIYCAEYWPLHILLLLLLLLLRELMIPTERPTHPPLRWTISRTVIVLLMYHRHKPIDNVNRLGSKLRHNVFPSKYGQT
jgi:hypothetical protein